MATYTLSGTGVQALSASVVALHVTITTLPASAGSGFANPADHYGVGMLRPGDASAYWDAFAVSGGPQWLPLPWGTTRLAYALLDSAGISVAEVFSPAPLAYPLALLPDVAIVSPTATQVLTYNGTQWANAAAPSGGGGSGGSGTALIQTILLSATAASITFTSIPSTFSHLQLRWAARGDATGIENSQQVQFNSDTSSNYTSNYSYSGSGGYSNNASVNGTALTFPDVAFNGSGTGVFGVGGAEIMFYTGLVQKGCISEGMAPINTGGTSLYRFFCSGLWHSTAAITSITMFPVSGSYVARSIFSLYGLP